MSAELLLATLVIDKTQTPDFGAAHRAVEAIEPDDVLDADYFAGADPGEPDGLRRIRRRAHLDLRALEEALAGWRDVAEFVVRGALVYASGGMSSGDAPAQTFALITRLRALGGVLAAAGFEEAAEERC